MVSVLQSPYLRCCVIKEDLNAFNKFNKGRINRINQYLSPFESPPDLICIFEVSLFTFPILNLLL